MARILIVEDEEILRVALAASLRRVGHLVDVASDGHEALAKCDTVAYELVILDRDLPILHGDEVCRDLVESDYPARIIMVTAAREIPDTVTGLALGADDYITKPFSLAILLARIEAVLRRPDVRRPEVVVVGDLSIDPRRRSVTRSGREILLTAKEFGVLNTLAECPGEFVSAENLLNRVWDENADPFTNAVRVTMVGLRHKLGEPPLISTHRGSGYRLDPGATPPETSVEH